MAIPSFIFGGDTNETPDSIKRKREIANALARGALSNAPKDIGSGLSAIGQALIYRKMMKDADKAETGFKSEAQADADAFIDSLGGVGSTKPSSTSGGAYGGAIPLPGAAGEVGVNVPDGLKSGIKATAESLGISPVDLATAISYETGGTFDPVKSGPTTQWGKHRGLIQFGEPQAEKYGVDWNNPVGSQLGPDGAVAKYLRDAGVKPGMGMLDIYSAINAGGVGRYNASDANNGGAPGTVRDKVEKQMSGHRAKALAMFGGDQVASLDPSAGMTAADAINAIAPTQRQSGPEQAYVDPAVKVVNPVVEALTKGGNSPAVPPAIVQALANRGQQRGATIGDLSMTYDESGARVAPDSYSRPQPQNPYSGPGAQIDTPMPVYDEQGMRMQSPMPTGQAMAGAPGNALPLPLPQAIQPQPPTAGAQQPQGQPQAMPQPQAPQAPVEVAQATQGDMGQGYFPAAPNAPDQSGPSMRQIMRVLQNPYSSPEVKALAAQQLEKMQQANDPAYQQQQQLRQMQMEKTKLELEGLKSGEWTKLDGNRLYNPRTGEINDLPAAANATPSDLGLNPQYGVDQQGNPVILQLGKDGKVIKSQMPEGVALSKEPIKLDAGTHFVLLDPITRQPVGQVPKDMAGAELEKASGKAQGEAKAALPAVEGAANELLSSIDSLYNDPYLGNMLGPIDSRTPNLTTDAARVQSKMDRIGGQTFLQAFNSLRGGGQITEIEGEKATAAMARLNAAQSEADYKAALDELRGVVQRAVDRARQAAGGGAQQASPAAPPQQQQGSRLRFNPQTGELE